MSKEYKMSKAEKEYNDYIKNCPDWYWVHGLHDATVLGIQTEELLADYGEKDYKYNKMEILLDCNGALFEKDIAKITLYNYKIISGNLPDCDKYKVWWLRDTLTGEAKGKYNLSLVLENEKRKHFSLEIKFQFAETERKQ